MRHPDIEVDPFFFDRPETVLQLQLGLATNLYRNGHYEQGRPYLQDCLQSWGEIKGLRPGELEHLTTDELRTLYQEEDDDFFNALVPVLLNSEAQHIPDQLPRLLKGWSDLKRQ